MIYILKMDQSWRVLCAQLMADSMCVAEEEEKEEGYEPSSSSVPSTNSSCSVRCTASLTAALCPSEAPTQSQLKPPSDHRREHACALFPRRNEGIYPPVCDDAPTDMSWLSTASGERQRPATPAASCRSRGEITCTCFLPSSFLFLFCSLSSQTGRRLPASCING